MTSRPPRETTPGRPAEPAAAALAVGGLAAAFGAAACCALPLGLAALGLGTAWLGSIALAAAPHQGLLMALSAASLLGAGLLVLRAWRRTDCRTDGACARPAYRGLTIAGLLVGGALLGAGYAFA